MITNCQPFSSTVSTRKQRGGLLTTTLDLLEHALSLRPSSISELSRHLGFSRSALNVYRLRGHVPPRAAVSLAKYVGEDPNRWGTIAALETGHKSAR